MYCPVKISVPLIPTDKVYEEFKQIFMVFIIIP